MTTPLFPPNDGSITIKQGRGGDCYLLAAVDCLLNSGQGGYALLKSLFVEKAGGVEVRIKRTEQSKLLQMDKIHGKFIYYYDQMTNQDVFFLDRKRLDDIDRPGLGVVSNSLAIKILERLSSYYYVNHLWNPHDPSASVMAHNLPYRHLGYETAFVANLLGVSAQDYINIYDIVKLKTIAPQEPVYIALDWGDMDAYGQRHGAHALRVDKVIPNAHSPGGYDVVLVNPWDNQKREIFNINDLIQRRSRFATFSINPYQPELTRALLSQDEHIGKAVFADPNLLNMLLKIREGSGALTPNVIINCVTLHEQLHFLPVFFNSLPIEQQAKVFSCILNFNGNMNAFLSSFLSVEPSLGDQVQKANMVIAHYVNQINKFVISFESPQLTSIDSINKYEEFLLKQLHGIVSDQIMYQTKEILGLPSLPAVDKAYLDKINEVKEAAQNKRITKAKNVIIEFTKEIAAFPVAFNHITIHENVIAHSHELSENLLKFVINSKKLEQAKQILGVAAGQHLSVILEAINRQNQIIQESAQQQLEELKKQEVESRIKKINDIKISFADHLKTPEDVTIHRLELELELTKIYSRRCWFDIRPLVKEAYEHRKMRIDLEADTAIRRLEGNYFALGEFGLFAVKNTAANPDLTNQSELKFK
ncbi:thiol protease [Legionella gratiana]|uniref:Thiol protease n=1 Tax=Legionella gratiana TaxID=45066 RepID=A0A378JAU5_9GAMM|nr:hypothetical protein [Legionella gratiana]KTD11057.1 thiol protease [Legionella gratiana]STX44599.1 thiol protease [Legionella gratiana]